jgi:hypothetical protein
MTIITEATPILDKARAGRRAALTSLHARLGHTDKVVSIFDNAFPIRAAEPTFHSVRAHAHRRPTLVLTERAAA